MRRARAQPERAGARRLDGNRLVSPTPAGIDRALRLQGSRRERVGGAAHAEACSTTWCGGGRDLRCGARRCSRWLAHGHHWRLHRALPLLLGDLGGAANARHLRQATHAQLCTSPGTTAARGLCWGLGRPRRRR